MQPGDSIRVYTVSLTLGFTFLHLCSNTSTFVCKFQVWSSRPLNTKYNLDVVGKFQIFGSFPISLVVHLVCDYLKTKFGNESFNFVLKIV